MRKVVTTSRDRPKGIQRVDLAYAKLASSEVARDINRDVVLELIRTKQPVSRADLSRLSGLQPSTISSIADQLIREEWICEGAAVNRPRGRRPTLLSLNSNMVILVADIRPKYAIVAIVDLNGQFIDRAALPLVADPGRGVARLVECMQKLLASHPEYSFEGIGLILPGRVDPEKQRLILAPNLPWTEYDIKQAIEAAIPLQVEMDNDANACLLSELWFGRMDGVRNAVLVAISEGIGTAILAEGHLITGRFGLAGEFGHVTLDPAGPLCGCGRRGCWEMFASSRAAAGYYADLKGSAVPDVLELLRLAEDEDEYALKALQRQALYLGRGLRIVTAALSPELILINGPLTSSWSRFQAIVEEELAGGMLPGSAPRLAITSDAEQARLRGAAALVLQRHSGSTRSQREKKPVRRIARKKQANTATAH